MDCIDGWNSIQWSHGKASSKAGQYGELILPTDFSLHNLITLKITIISQLRWNSSRWMGRLQREGYNLLPILCYMKYRYIKTFETVRFNVLYFCTYFSFKKIQDSGLYDKLAQKWTPQMDLSKCESNIVLPLGLHETFPIFVILGCSLIVSIVVVVLENSYFRWTETRVVEMTRLNFRHLQSTWKLP